MGEVWKGYSEEEKKPFEEMASQDKERYQRELAENPPPAKKKKRKAKSAPAKKKKTKKQKVVVQEDSSSDDDDDMSFVQMEIKAKLNKILKDPSLDKGSLGMKSLKKMLSAKMNGADLKPYKSFIKAHVMAFLANQQ